LNAFDIPTAKEGKMVMATTIRRTMAHNAADKLYLEQLTVDYLQGTSSLHLD
jgi:hypothetical protein